MNGNRGPYISAAAHLVLGAGIGMAAGWTLGAWRSGNTLAADSGYFARAAALAHAVYAPEVRHPVEVWADEKPHLIAWLSKRLQTEVRAPDLASAGFGLLGGRLLPGEAPVAGVPLPAAQFMYENPTGRRVTLYVDKTRRHELQAEPRYAGERGVAVLHWGDGALAYALASVDVSRGELSRLAQLIRN